MLCTQPDRLLGIYELPGEAWNMSQGDQTKRSLQGRSIQPQTREGSLVGQGPPSSQPVWPNRGRLLPKEPGRKEKRELRKKAKEEGGLRRRDMGVWSLLVLRL